MHKFCTRKRIGTLYILLIKQAPLHHLIAYNLISNQRRVKRVTIDIRFRATPLHRNLTGIKLPYSKIRYLSWYVRANKDFGSSLLPTFRPGKRHHHVCVTPERGILVRPIQL